MAIQWGDTGKVSIGTFKKFDITLATPKEIVFNPVVDLPTASPTSGDGVVLFTVESSDLPTISPNPYSIRYVAHVVVSGRNSSGASGTVNFSILKNGTSVISNQSQTGISNTNYWSQTHYRWADVVIGDTLEVRLWGGSTGFTLEYAALIVYPYKPELSKVSILNDVNFTLGAPSLTASGLSPNVSVTQGWNYYPSNLSGSGISSASNFNLVASTCGTNATHYFGRPFYETSGSFNTTHATLRPSYARCHFPTQIAFREVLR